MKKAHTILITALLLSSALAALAGIPETATAAELTPRPVPVRLNTNVKEALTMGASGDGRIYVAWTERLGSDLEVMFSYSSNNGSAFAPAARVNAQSAGSQKGSQLAVANDTLYIVWEDGSLDSGDIVLARSGDGGQTFDEVRVSDYEDGTQSHPSIAANGDVVAIAWEEHRSDNTIRVWNGADGSLVRELSGHLGAVRDVEYSPDGSRIASASEDATVKIWDTSGYTLARNLTHHKDKVTALNWSADGSRLVTGSFDGDVILYDTSDFSIISRLNSTGGVPTRNHVNALSFSPDSGQMAVAYNGRYGTDSPTGFPALDFNLTVWNTTDWSSWTLNENTPGTDLIFFTSSVTDAAFSHDGMYLAAGSKAGVKKEGDTVTEHGYTLRVFDPADGQVIRSVKLERPVHSVAWSPDDRFIAAGLDNGSIALVNTTSWSVGWLTGSHTGRVNSLDWSSELVSGASDPKAKIWFDRASPYFGVERKNLTGHMNSVYAVDRSSNALSIVTAGGTSSQYGMGENQIFCAVSRDAGLTFSSPVLVSDSCAFNRFRPKVGIDGNGVISVAWYDSRSGGTSIYFANSTDPGAGFGRNVGIDTTSPDCVLPRLFVEESGTAHVVWQYGLGDGILYSNSTDSFATSRIMTLNAQEPRISGSPDGSSLWVGWRQQNTTAITAAVSYDGGSSFPDTVLLNASSALIRDHAIHVDMYNQTYVAWEAGGNIYSRTTVLADTWGPRILSTLPENGDTDVSIFTTFAISFSEPMNRDATEAAFSWTDGTETWYVGDCVGNKGDWNPYGDRVTFTPRNPLQYQKSNYYFRVANTASDVAGNILGSNMSFHFTTGADVDPPLIEHFPSQYTVSYDATYSVIAVIRDQWGTVDSARLFYQGVNDDAPTTSLEMSLTGTDIYEAVIPAQQSLGTILYYIQATDEYGNTAWSPANYTNRSQLHNVSVVDSVNPEISHVPVVEADVFRDIEIWAVVTDSIMLESVWLNYRPLGSALYTQVPMPAAEGSPNTFRQLIPAQQGIGMIHYNITALDTSGNFNSTAPYSVQILDRTAPLINSVTPELMANNTKVLVRANVTDDVGVGSVTLYFKAVGGDAWVSRPMAHVSGDIYEFTIPPQRRSGAIYYYVNATDSSGNQASTLAEQDQFQIEVVGVGSDNTLYYVLGAVLAALMIVLVYLVIKRFSGPMEPDEMPEESVPPEEAQSQEELAGDEPEKADGSP